jgi:hypothetical protein
MKYEIETSDRDSDKVADIIDSYTYRGIEKEEQTRDGVLYTVNVDDDEIRDLEEALDDARVDWHYY